MSGHREGDWPLPAVLPLDPALEAYLDYPLYIPDDSVACNRTECPNRDCENGTPYLASHRRMTVREVLADIRSHAGG